MGNALRMALLLITEIEFVAMLGKECQISEVEGPCLPGYFPIEHVCLYIETRPMTWEKALKSCRERSGDLVEISDKSKDIEIFVLMRSQIPSNYWIGLNDRKEDTVYVWSKDGSEITPSSYQNIDQFKFPPPREPVKNCVTLEGRQTDGDWSLQDCEELHMSLCEIKSLDLPERPDVSARDQPSSRISLVEGQYLETNCSVFLSALGTLRFVLLGDKTLFIDMQDTRVQYFEGTKVRPNGHCAKYAIAVLRIKATDDLEGTRVGCVVYEDDKIEPCSPQDPFCTITGIIRVDPEYVNEEWKILLLVPIFLIMLATLVLARMFLDLPASSWDYGEEEDGDLNQISFKKERMSVDLPAVIIDTIPSETNPVPRSKPSSAKSSLTIEKG